MKVERKSLFVLESVAEVVVQAFVCSSVCKKRQKERVGECGGKLSYFLLHSRAHVLTRSHLTVFCI